MGPQNTRLPREGLWCRSEHSFTWKELAQINGFVGIHACSIVLDSGADSTMIAEDLVPEAAYTGTTQHIAGVHAVGCDMLLANMKITIGG